MTGHPGSGNTISSKWIPASWAWVILLSVVGAIFAAAQVSIANVNGLWNDELFALWASDTSAPFSTIYVTRIAPDTNPPFYFSALYWTRLFISDDRAAILTLNILCIAAAGATVLLVSRRARLTGLAALSVAAFVLSGPVMLYAPEGRAYLAALAISFVASWCVALAIEEPQSRPSLPIFIALGAVAALIHVYAALFCGALAAGLFILALCSTRWRRLLNPSLALGLSASMVLGVWFITITGSLDRVDWMEFTPRSVVTAAWYVKELTVGDRVLALLLVLLLLLGIAHKRTRPLMFVFGVAYALFFALPMIASLKKPMIMGRYWLIGAPSLIPLLAFMARAWHLDAPAGTRFGWPRHAVFGVGVLALVTSISGFLVARNFTSSKPIWTGAEITRPLMKDCPEGSVHVGTGAIDNARTSLHYFAKVAGTSPSLFVNAGAPSTSNISGAAAACPVIGWAEHVLLGDDFLLRATDAELLRLLKIDASPPEVDIRRHKSGFVVLDRRDPR